MNHKSGSIFNCRGKLRQSLRTDGVKVTDSPSSGLPLNYNLSITFLKGIVLLQSNSCNFTLIYLIYSKEAEVIRNIKVQQVAQLYTIYLLPAQQLSLPIS